MIEEILAAGALNNCPELAIIWITRYSWSREDIEQEEQDSSFGLADPDRVIF
ncbi:MAG: hypothetical protein JO076_05735 [Verrucomicrobia bacterium]|nr:hypothetical protein [Verrucomicrobiota bacterium]